MPKFSERFSFDLADALAGDGKMLADLFESVLRTRISESKTHFDHLFLTRSERCEHLIGYFTQVRKSYGFGRVKYRAVFDKITQMRIFFFADRRFKRYRFLRYFQNLSHL